MAKRIFTLLTALAVIVAARAPMDRTARAEPGGVTVYPGHPRLIVGGYRGVSIAQMKARCADQLFGGRCDNIGAVAGHVLDLAMDYLLHNDTAAANNAISALQTGYLGCSYEGVNAGGYALAYDWVYNVITSTTVKDAIEKRLADCAESISSELDSDNPHFWHAYTSNAATLALIALALDRDSRRSSLLSAAEAKFRNNALQAYAYVDGAWPEGVSYFRSHFFSADPPSQYVIDAVRAWRSAVQQDSASYADMYDTIRYQEGDWLRRAGYFHIYSLLPPYGTTSPRNKFSWARHGDMPSTRPETSNQHRPYLDAIADAYSDGYLQQLGRIIEGDWGLTGGQASYHFIHQYALPTNLNPAVPTATFAALPTAALFGRNTIGYAAMRSDWSNSAAILFYRAGDWFTGHQHMDQGHFEIWRNGPLAVDSGVYANWGTEHHESYYIRTVAHNSLLIRQPGEAFASSYSVGRTNDGGQRVHTGVSCAQCIQSLAEYKSNVGAGKHYEAGDITAYIHANEYDYWTLAKSGSANG